MSKGLYFAYQQSWRKENPASKYDLSPGAALMLRTIIDETNAKFWPSTPIRMENSFFYISCNFKNREMIRKCRQELMDAKLIDWHKDMAHKNKSGFYQLLWQPVQVVEEIQSQYDISCQVYLTPTTPKLRIVNG